jgi:hypothetical protein
VRLREFLRLVIFGRRGCDPRLVPRYRRIAAFDFVVGIGIPVLLAGHRTGVGLVPLVVFSLLLGVPIGSAIGRWLVPAEGLQPR